jgi:hypothetical protein
METVNETKPGEALAADHSAIENGAAQDGSDPAGEIADALVIEWEPGSRGATILKARYDGKLFHSDTFNLARGEARKKFVKEVARKGKEQLQVAIPADAIEARLMAIADELGESKGDEGGGEAAYKMVESEDPDSTGIYRMVGERESRLTNFTAWIDEDVLVQEEGRENRRFVGHTWLGGQRRPFTLSATEFANNEKLQAILTTSAGSGAVFLDAKIPPVRVAMGLVGREQRVNRSVSADHGWHRQGDKLRYLTLNGYVDAGGFHDYSDDPSIMRVELLGVDLASRLRLLRLDADRLKTVGQHLVDDYLQLHDRPVMLGLLAAAATAVLEPFAGHDQRFALWLKGLSGSGKSFASRTTASLFGDFDPGSGRHYAGWSWTANTIEKAGFAFRGAVYLVDDFKLDLARKTEAIRILQLYADGQGRGRLFADTRSAPVWPIRGMLISSGEDVPQSSSSALARMIVVEVPNRPKDLERGRRCRQMRSDYPGLMAAFIADLIGRGRTEKFKDRVAQWTEAYYKGIEGLPNDARIAGNFGILAAASREFAAFLGRLGFWPGWKAEVDAFRQEDLVAIRDSMLRLVGTEQPSAIFLDTLRNLLTVREVRLKAGPHSFTSGETGHEDRIPLIGRVEGGRVGIIPGAALAAVQRALRAQGRPELAITTETLLEQFVADGLLLNDQGQPIQSQDKGRRVFQQRMFQDGSRTYVAILPMEVLGLDEPRVPWRPT